jgi:hypothetical protein
MYETTGTMCKPFIGSAPRGELFESQEIWHITNSTSCVQANPFI